ncbi:FIVAR domain-containing protein [Butyricicoccus pullicaecorum]|uniref:GLUG domain-containing protein n=1 Tax=Butyricicoccus pullicaecorum TaxID=501571 RepID=A0A1Y4LSW4_9FIRM|nr:FIVAR domain-containing protein [Butyricicoccus pullicaecorum]OUP59738.1 hypothetical protein B5F15_04780 [Butyricicoccus pullicaecorum]
MGEENSYTLANDIELSDWESIDFAGTLGGNGHTITLAGQPLFNELSGNVQNLCLTGEVTDEDGIVGALARTQTAGTVNNCWSGAEYDWYAELFAGFVGTMSGGTIKNCLSTCDMGDAGLVAEVSGQSAIENCYYTHYNAVYDGEFTGSGNESISSSDYERVMVQLNAAHEERLPYWVMDEGVPKPISSDEPETDRTALQELYDSVKDMTNAVPGEEGVYYTPESWAAFVAARTKANEVLEDQDATQAAIDAAKEALQAAIDGLTPDHSGTTVEQRKTLQELIGKAPTEKGCYTDESFSAVATQVEAAEKLLADSAATAEQLTAQIDALQNAINALKDIKSQVAVVAPPDGQWQMISTAKELAALSEKGGTGYYKLANDITEYVGYYSFSSKDPAFNGVLDGDGHTVTFADADKNPNPVINTLGSDGVIQNLGVKGSISNPALVNKLDGKLINCYSWAESHYGGLVGEMRSGSVIANCYVNKMPGGSNSGGLVMTGRGGHILNSYWPSGEAIGDNENTSVLDSEAVAKQKEDSFRTMLNENPYGGMTWNQSETGLPWLGEDQEYVKPDFETVTVTSLITEETTSIEDPDDVLQVSAFGKQDGGVATLTIDGYQGDELEWETPSHPTNAPIMVYYDKKLQETKVWVRDAGTVTVTAFLKATENTPRKELQSFQIEAKVPNNFDLKLKIDGVDYTGKTYTVPGSEGFELVPYVSIGGQEIPVYYGLFDWDSSNSEVIHVDSDALLN